MTFGKPSPRNPVFRSGLKKILDLSAETPKQRRSSKSAAKNLFPEARAKRSEDIFDPEIEMDSPVIKFSGSTRAFNTTTQAKLEIY